MTIVTCNYHYDLEKAFNGKVTHDIQKGELHVHCEKQVVIIQEPSFSPVILFTHQDGQWLFCNSSKFERYRYNVINFINMKTGQHIHKKLPDDISFVMEHTFYRALDVLLSPNCHLFVAHERLTQCGGQECLLVVLDIRSLENIRLIYMEKIRNDIETSVHFDDESNLIVKYEMEAYQFNHCLALDPSDMKEILVKQGVVSDEGEITERVMWKAGVQLVDKVVTISLTLDEDVLSSDDNWTQYYYCNRHTDYCTVRPIDDMKTIKNGGKLSRNLQ